MNNLLKKDVIFFCIISLFLFIFGALLALFWQGFDESMLVLAEESAETDKELADLNETWWFPFLRSFSNFVVQVFLVPIIFVITVAFIRKFLPFSVKFDGIWRWMLLATLILFPVLLVKSYGYEAGMFARSYPITSFFSLITLHRAMEVLAIVLGSGYGLWVGIQAFFKIVSDETFWSKIFASRKIFALVVLVHLLVAFVETL